MALKDWKDISSIGKGWTFKKKLKVLQISQYGLNTVIGVAVRVWEDAGWTSEKLKLNNHFKTLAEARKFARSYMRSH